MKITFGEQKRKEIIEEIRKYRYESHYVLSSGKTSNYYYDIKGFLCNPSNMIKCEKYFINEISNLGTCDFIGGMEVGSVPLTSILSRDLGIKSFIVRKEPKLHGIGSKIICSERIKGKVGIIEDVITTGKTISDIISILKNVDICGIYCVVNRLNSDYYQGFPIYSIVDDEDFK